MEFKSVKETENEMKEAVTDEMLDEAVDVCKSYKKVMARQEEAEQKWRNLLRMAEDAPVQREKQMYNRMAEDAIREFMQLKAWTDRAWEAVSLIPVYKSFLVIRQHYFEGRAMSAIEVRDGELMSRTTATRYKKLGLRLYALALCEYDRRKAEDEKE